MNFTFEQFWNVAFWVLVGLFFLGAIVASIFRMIDSFEANRSPIAQTPHWPVNSARERRLQAALSALIESVTRPDSELGRDLTKSGLLTQGLSVRTALLAELHFLLSHFGNDEATDQLTAKTFRMYCGITGVLGSNLERVSDDELIGIRRENSGFDHYFLLNMLIACCPASRAMPVVEQYKQVASAMASLLSELNAFDEADLGLALIEGEMERALWLLEQRSQNVPAAIRICERVEAIAEFIESTDQQTAAEKLLGLEPDFTQEQLKVAHRDQVARWHPDRLHGMAPELIQVANQRTQELNAAYAHLSQVESLNVLRYRSRTHL